MGFSCTAIAQEQPTAAMLKPVQGLMEFMRALPAGHPDVFTREGLCIIENFPPYLFCARQAANQWENGVRAHFAQDKLSRLVAKFGPAQDYSRHGDRAYFSLPTTWTGLTHGREFEEHGAWAFVLKLDGVRWRIVGYGWGVTSYLEKPG